MPHWAHIVLEVVVIGVFTLAALFLMLCTLFWIVAKGDQ